MQSDTHRRVHNIESEGDQRGENEGSRRSNEMIGNIIAENELPVASEISLVTITTDLALCSSCGKYVCEKCNEIPINKLKQMVKVCELIHFLRKKCNAKIIDDQNSETYSDVIIYCILSIIVFLF